MLLKDDMEKARDARKRDSETMPRELSDDNNPSSEQVTPDWGFDLYLESRACEHSISFKAAGNPAIAELTKPEYREETRLLLDAIQGDDMLRGFCIPASEQKEADEGQESDSKILEVWCDELPF